MSTALRAKIFISSTLLALSMSSAAVDIEAGKAKAGVCLGCHGAAGISPMDAWPNLANQKTGYLVKQMKAFRDGSRNDPIMNGQAKGLSDADIDNLAAYYNSLK